MNAPRNLYVHFPFCRRKCAYCALYSRAGTAEETRDDYVRRLAEYCRAPDDPRGWLAPGALKTIYFGGGSPALCRLAPLFDALSRFRADECEFTVELHPLDVSDALLAELRAGGVNRISMGVQSLDDRTLADMGRGYTAADARAAFDRIRAHFENAGIDLILGYPGPSAGPREAESLAALAGWGLAHCSVYSLIVEPRTLLARRLSEGAVAVPDDETTMNAVARAAEILDGMGLKRYEISNYARPGFECRHNLAVWRGEDYIGLGSGASGRVGCWRTTNLGPFASPAPEIDEVTSERDALERRLFRLRTSEGLDAAGYPDWRLTLDGFVSEGLLQRFGDVYRLTPRGTEVCDTMLAALV